MHRELYGLIFGLVVLETVGQYLARKYYQNKDRLWMFILSIICYIVIVYALVKTYNYENIGIVNALWSGIALVTVAIVGYFFFDESFNKWEYVGIGLILGGTLLIGFKQEPKKQN